MRAVMPRVRAEAETSIASDFTCCGDQSPLGKLVLNQLIGGGCVRYAQKRLCEHHEGEPLFRGQRIGMEKVLNAPERGSQILALMPSMRQRAVSIDPAFGGGWAARPNEKLARDRFHQAVRRARGRKGRGLDPCRGERLAV